LHAKGVEQLERGNIFAARKFFEHATAAGLAQSAVALASTYDPDELAKIKVVGLQPNIEEARKWYEKARELGAAEASERLRRLGACPHRVIPSSCSNRSRAVVTIDPEQLFRGIPSRLWSAGRRVTASVG
jgi:hypothetical protein